MKKKATVYTTAEKTIPKLCSAVTFAIYSNKNVIITLTFKEQDQETVIERVVVTPAHMKLIAGTAQKIVDELSAD